MSEAASTPAADEVSPPRDGESRDRAGSREHEHADHEQDTRRPVRRSTTPGHELLERDDAGDERHPDDAHHPEREQRGHQRPTTADAPSTVLDAHPQPARGSVAPGAEQEAEWAAAFPEADVLQRRQFVNGGDDEGR